MYGGFPGVRSRFFFFFFAMPDGDPAGAGGLDGLLLGQRDAEDAVLVDTSDMDIPQVVACIKEIIREKTEK